MARMPILMPVWYWAPGALQFKWQPGRGRCHLGEYNVLNGLGVVCDLSDTGPYCSPDNIVEIRSHGQALKLGSLQPEAVGVSLDPCRGGDVMHEGLDAVAFESCTSALQLNW